MSQAGSSSYEGSSERAEETDNTSDQEGEEGERNSDSDSDSSDDSDTGSDDSSAEDEDGTSEDESEEEEDGDDKEAKLVSKRDDFEKLAELSAHMDNIVKRLSRYFPLESEKNEDNTHSSPPVPEPPRFPVLDTYSEPTNICVSATANTVDRAVSARRLTTDRAVSVASGRHFENESSDSGGLQTENHEAIRAPSGIVREWGRGTGVDSRSTHIRNQATAVFTQETAARSDHPDVSSIPNAEREIGAPSDRRGRDAHEHVLWEDLRASLAGAADLEDILHRGHRGVTESSRGTVMATGAEEERRRLIEQAIAVLLEDTDEEDLLETGEL